MKHVAIIIYATFLQSAALAQEVPLTEKTNEIIVGPVQLGQNVNGVQVNELISVRFSLKTENNAINLKAKVDADLSDLQHKFSQIVNTIPLPKDNCAHYTLLNPVASISGATLESEGKAAVVHLVGSVDGWTCLQNPVPETYWDPTGCRGDLPFGGHYVFGCPKTRPGSPIKNKSITQPVNATLPFELSKPNATTLALAMGQPTIQLSGQLSSVTNAILNIAGVDVSSEAKRALDKAIDPNSLVVSIPPDYRALNPTIEDTYFYSNNGHLTAHVELSAAVPAQTANLFLTQMVGKLKS